MMSAITTEIWEHASFSQRLLGSVILIGLAIWIPGLFSTRPSSTYPTINSKKNEFRWNARQLLNNAARKYAGPYKVLTDSGPLIMLPPEQIDAINATDSLSFNEYVGHEFQSKFETFRVMRPPPTGMFEEAVIKGITRALPKYTKPISKEMTACLNETWGHQDEWKEVKLMDDILIWVARLSNRIFLGDKFTTNKDWLRITTTYTINIFMAIGVTKAFHPLLKPVVDFLSPLNRRCRGDYALASEILKPVLDSREKEIRLAEKEGRAPDLPDDAIEWFRNAAHGREYRDIDTQLALAIAAIHTTSDLLCQALLNLATHPELQQPLREEAIRVLSSHGLQKVSLTELRLLDSFLKETQRLKPINMASMHRTATSNVTLPGTNIQIQKGEHLAISSQRMWDSTIYSSPETFDAYRYIERRKIPGQENRSLLVSTSPEHLGFSHGKHACPGRFFAANEVKIAMLHLILKYEVKLAGKAEEVKWQSYGTAMFCKRGAKILMRSRVAEVDLERLAGEL